MAALTWREVSGPNFGGTNAAFANGAQLQSNAFASLGDAIQKFRQQQAASVDSAVLARALQVNDPAAYQKNLSDGTFLEGVNPASLSPETLQALGSRATSLQNLSGTQYQQNRTREVDQIQDAARTPAAQAYGITDPRLAALSPEQQLAVASGNLSLRRGEQGLRQGEVSIVGGQLGNENQQFRNRTQLRDDNAAQTGLAAGQNILRESATPSDARSGLEGRDNLSPQEYEAARRYLGNTMGDLYAPVGGGAPGAGAGGKPGTKSGSPYDTTFNFQGTNTPLTNQPIGSVLNTQEASRQSQGHSPMGAFQINKATLEDYGPKVLGDKWKEQEFTPETQEKLAKAIFEDRKGGDLSKTWASLSNTSPGAYKDFSWDQMRGLIAQGEVGQNLPDDPASLRLLSQQSQFDVSRRAAQNNSVGVVADVAKNLSDTRPVGEVVQEAIKNQFPGADQGKLLGMVNEIQRENPGLSAADAMSAVTRSTRDSSWWRKGTTTFGDGIGVDDEALAANVESLKQGKADYMSNANQLTLAQGKSVADAQSRFDTASQNLMELQRRKQSQPRISTESAEKALEQANAALKRALNEQRSNSNYRPVRQ